MSTIKNSTIMELTLFDLSSLPVATSESTKLVKKTSASAFTTYQAESEVSWGDIYDEYEDFEVCSKRWARITKYIQLWQKLRKWSRRPTRQKKWQ